MLTLEEGKLIGILAEQKLYELFFVASKAILFEVGVLGRPRLNHCLHKHLCFKYQKPFSCLHKQIDLHFVIIEFGLTNFYN